MKKTPSLVINVNDICNFKCVYCPPYGENLCKGRSTCDIKAIYKVMDLMSNHGSKLLRLTGGEPLIDIAKTVDFLRYSKGRFQRTVLNTNGFYLKDCLDALEEFKSFLTIKVSLDSLDAAEAKNISGVDGLDKVLVSIFEAKARGFMIEINTVLTGQAVESIEKIVTFCHDNCFDLKILTRSSFYGHKSVEDYRESVFAIINWLQNNLVKQESQRLETGMGLAMLTYKNGSNKIFVVDHSLNGSITPQKLFFSTCSSQCFCYPCDCGVLSITISTDGILTPCRGRKDMGDVIYSKTDAEIENILSSALKYFETCMAINVNEIN